MLRIHTGSRLHFGLFNYGTAPGHFGGVGLMIEQPGLTLMRRLRTTGRRKDRWLRGCWSSLVRFTHEGDLNSLQPQHFRVESAAPEHVGLGTGTQLGLATARLLAEAYGLRETPVELAKRVGRGLRSALGLHGFERGGFLVEAGKRATHEPSPLVAHFAFSRRMANIDGDSAPHGGLARRP